ncbi:MAG: GH32 C-terminal domain-containing protein, partial [Ruminococcus sp.]|nr:GH32 C-terminal domain-containing protein [Ruminococcus sp.]
KQAITDGKGELQLPFDLKGAVLQDSFELNLGKEVHLNYKDGVFTLRFTDAKVGCGRDVRRARLDSCNDLRVLADKTSMEIFINNGETVFSTRFYPQDTQISITAKGLSCEVSQLSPMQLRYLGE